MNAKLKNVPCQTCSILPFCRGGCSQVAMENYSKNYCVCNFDDNTSILQVYLKNMLKTY
ncbi:MAG: hypothetical protein ACK5H1_05180 [Tenacibaculum sp.]